MSRPRPLPKVRMADHVLQEITGEVAIKTKLTSCSRSVFQGSVSELAGSLTTCMYLHVGYLLYVYVYVTNVRVSSVWHKGIVRRVIVRGRHYISQKLDFTPLLHMHKC